MPTPIATRSRRRSMRTGGAVAASTAASPLDELVKHAARFRSGIFT